MSLPGVYYDDSINPKRWLGALAAHDPIERYLIPTKVQMLEGLDAKKPWLCIDDTYRPQILERYRLLQQHPHLTARLPGTDVTAAEIELRDHVISHLLATYPQYFVHHDGIITSKLSGLHINPAVADPLICIALLASEDMLLMLPDASDDKTCHRIKSGALLFPSGWSLVSRFTDPEPADPVAHKVWEQKKADNLEAARLGKSAREIHQHSVPYYMNNFSPKVDMMLKNMPCGEVRRRSNWTIHTTPELCQNPDIRGESPPYTVANWYKHGVLRPERQSFIKLPKSHAVIFSIKVYAWPIGEILSRPQALQNLIETNNNVPEDMVEYRNHSLPSFSAFLASLPREMRGSRVKIHPKVYIS